MKTFIDFQKIICLIVFATPLYLIKFSIWKIPLNILEALIAGVFILWILQKKLSFWLLFWKKHRTYIVFLIIIAAGLIISALMNENYRVSFGIIKSWFIIPWIFSFIVLSEIKKENETQNILKTLFFSAFLISFIGLGYFLAQQLTFDGRLKAFYLSPNHLAMFLAPAILIGIMKGAAKIKENKKQAFFWIALTFFMALILYLTQSLTTIFALTGSFLLIKIITQGKKFFFSKLFFYFLLGFVIFAFFQWNSPKIQDLKNNFERSSFSSRLMIWNASIKILKNNPLFGIGPGNFQNKYLEYQKYFPPYLEWAVPHPHNLCLSFWLQSGLLGFLGFLSLAAWQIKKIIGVLKKNDDFSFSVLSAIIFYVLLHGLIDTPIWKNDLSVIFWTITALLFLKISYLETNLENKKII